MSDERKVSFPKKKVGISTTISVSRKKNVPIRTHNGDRLHAHSKKEGNAAQRERSLTELINELSLTEYEKENLLDPLHYEDIRRKPDLWMAAFDNPVDFIQYCRKKIDHERETLEKSRLVEDEIRQFVEEWSKNTEKHAKVLDDLYKVQDINDKLQEAIMEERTHCQHLVGENDQLETQKQILERKYQASLLLGKVDDRAVNHLLERNPKAVPLADKLSRLRKEIKSCEGKQNLIDVADPTVLAVRVQTLEKYVENLKRQHREEVTVLKETINQGELKCSSIKAQYTDLVQRNAKSLQELKEVLGVTIRENLNLREELMKKDAEFLESHSKEVTQRLRKPPSSRIMEAQFELHRSKSEQCTISTADIDREFQLKLTKTEIELAKKSNLLRETTQRILMLERKCARFEEENRALKVAHEHSTSALKSKAETLVKRCEKTETRLKMERAGNGSDLRECKTLLKTLITGVKTFSREHSDLKKKLAECTKKCSAAAQPDPESLEVVKAVTTQSNASDLKMHAMNLWLGYVQSKVNQLENQTTGSRGVQQGHQEEDDGAMNVMYVNPSFTEKSMERMRDFANSSDEMKDSWLAYRASVDGSK